MITGINGLSIAHFHDLSMDSPCDEHVASTPLYGPWHWIAENHCYNSRLWQEEDKARRTDVDATEIAVSKRLIDQYNQQRNDAIEALDEAILMELGNIEPAEGARLSSETAGAMIDRLSILALKIFHMREQTGRSDASAEHIDVCRNKLERLTMQREDLIACLDNLLEETAEGRAYFKVYRQFKMYNDPTLNPYLYQQRKDPISQTADSGTAAR
jgi:hypothetical protein